MDASSDAASVSSLETIRPSASSLESLKKGRAKKGRAKPKAKRRRQETVSKKPLISNDEGPKSERIEMCRRLKPYYRKPETFLLFGGDIVLELVLPDVVELQPELIFRYKESMMII